MTGEGYIPGCDVAATELQTWRSTTFTLGLSLKVRKMQLLSIVLVSLLPPPYKPVPQWMLLSLGICPPKVSIWTNVSEEFIPFIFRVKIPQSGKSACSTWLGPATARWFLARLIFNDEEGGDTFLRNGRSSLPLREPQILCHLLAFHLFWS
jgi:hypothetical protein